MISYSISYVRLWPLILLQILVISPLLRAEDAEIVDTIETKYGKLKGVVEEGIAGRKALVFRGVPFAKSPVGNLRFNDPQSLDKFASDPFEAVHNAKACKQLSASENEGSSTPVSKEDQETRDELEKMKPVGGFFSITKPFYKIEDSEDCLYMNIFVPATHSKEKRSMVLFLHGGMFSIGGVGPEVMDMAVFATANDVIVAAPQYRLGVFGFLYSNVSADVPGNQGLFDQLEALKFFRSLAEPLNGNLDSVTLWGWQSGGWSAGFHMFSSQSNQLFQQTIMESGSALSPLMLFPEEGAAARFKKFAVFANCGDMKEVEAAKDKESEGGEKDKEPQKEIVYELRPDSIECIKKLTTEEILKAQEKVLSSKKDNFMPVEDSRFFGGNPFDLVSKTDFGAVKSILLGTNSNEGGLLLTALFSDVYPLMKGEPKPMTLNQLLEHAKSRGGNSNNGQIQLMLPMFFRGVDKENPVAVRNHLQQLLKDALIVCLDQMLIDEYTQKPDKQAFYYLFDHRPSNSPFAEWLEGAQHADELQFVLGYPFKSSLKDHYQKGEQELSKKTLLMWGNFIKYGNPVAKTKIKWLPCKDKDRSYAQFVGKSCRPQKGFVKNQCKDLTRYYAMGRSFLKNYKS